MRIEKPEERGFTRGDGSREERMGMERVVRPEPVTLASLVIAGSLWSSPAPGCTMTRVTWRPLGGKMGTALSGLQAL